jgi:hypothetical protein
MFSNLIDLPRPVLVITGDIKSGSNIRELANGIKPLLKRKHVIYDVARQENKIRVFSLQDIRQFLLVVGEFIAMAIGDHRNSNRSMHTWNSDVMLSDYYLVSQTDNKKCSNHAQYQ